MKKKFKILIGCLVLLVMVFCISFYVKGAVMGQTELAVSSITANVNDENVIVPIKVENNKGICGMQLTISYDNNLVLKDVASSTALSCLSMTPPGDFSQNPVTILWDGIEADSSNGEIVLLTFENPKKIGNYDIIASFEEGDIVDNNLQPIKIKLTNGSIIIKDNSSETETTQDICEKDGHKGGTATCVKKAVCTVCGKEYGTINKSNHTGKTEVRNAKKATCKSPGYTYCKDCGTKLKTGKKITINHTWSAWKTTKSATALVKGSKYRTCKVCKKKETQPIEKLKPTIKLSATKKTIKKKKSYTLVISKLAKGDSVKSVTSSNKKIATVKKVSKTQYSIKATSKKGKVTIKVILASGKKATCAVTVK